MADSQAKPRPSRTVVRALNNLYQKLILNHPFSSAERGMGIETRTASLEDMEEKILSVK